MTSTQIGSNIPNWGTNSVFGVGNSAVVSGDGSTVVIGSATYGGGLGKFYVFTYNSGTNSWISQSITNNADVGNSNDYLGSSVAVSYDGNVIAVGAPQNNPINIGTGSSGKNGYVNIYGYSGGGSWSFSKIIVDSTITSTNNFFGYAVALSDDGKKLVVGAPGTNDTGNPLIGKITIHDLQYTTLLLGLYGNFAPGITNKYFGSSVAISGDGNTVVGSTQDSSINAVAILRYNTSSTLWDLISSISDIVGYSLALSYDGNELVVGDPIYNSEKGRVRLYKYNGSNFILVKELLGSSYLNFLHYGVSVSVSNNGVSVVVGSPNTNPTVPGTVHIYSWLGPGSSVDLFTTIDASTNPNFNYGAFVDISADGSRVAITEGNYSGSGSGVVRVYALPVTTTTTTAAPTSTTTSTTTETPTTTVAPSGACGWFKCC